jgi:hypothetical protein
MGQNIHNKGLAGGDAGGFASPQGDVGEIWSSSKFQDLFEPIS